MGTRARSIPANSVRATTSCQLLAVGDGTNVSGMVEDAASKPIRAARACQEFFFASFVKRLAIFALVFGSCALRASFFEAFGLR